MSSATDEAEAGAAPAPQGRDREHGLLAAVMAVGSDLDLQVVLRRIVEAARSLAGATYGALGVIDGKGTTLAQFLVVGMDDETAASIGPLPSGHGVLGELIRDPHALRLLDLSQHPASFGFPAGHPPMKTFLGVPVRVRDTVFGNLYLTDKRGGGAFDDEDEAVVRALATAAGVAIENARLYAASRQREQWLEAMAEVSSALLSASEPEDVLELVARLARAVTAGALSVVALPLDDDRLLIEHADGEGAGRLQGRLLERHGSVLGDVLAHGGALAVDAGDLGPSDTALASSGPGIAVPLGVAGVPARGVLAVTGLPDADHEVAVRTLVSFAAQAAVALELAERRRDAERYAVFEDRDRIARDLHDLVIQRLYATGMQLEGASRLVTARPQEASARVHRAVDDLDATIRELRSTIYGLLAPADEAPSLRALLLQAVDAGTEQLGFAPSLRLDGLLDTLVPAAVAEHLLAATREALSNAARHARATAVDVVVSARDGELPGEGTRFAWRVPLPAAKPVRGRS